MTSDGDPLLIIGAGAAGYGLLRAFRRRNRDAPVSLMTDDDGIVYARAELSRALATGKAARELILASAAEMAERYRVRLICRTRAHAIDRANRIVLTEDGPRAYDRLVLASGAEPLRPSIRGSGGHRLLTLSTLDEYRYLERELAGRDRVALLGGTLAACETALHLVAAGKTVVLFETASRLLGGRLPALSARRMAGLLEEAGVRLRTHRSGARRACADHLVRSAILVGRGAGDVRDAATCGAGGGCGSRRRSWDTCRCRVSHRRPAHFRGG